MEARSLSPAFGPPRPKRTNKKDHSSLGRDSLDTSYQRGALVAEEEAQLDKKNELIKS